VRGGDLAERLGGDEFVILLKGEDARRPEAIVERLEATMAAPIHISGRQLRIGTSVGVAQAREGDDREALLRAADAAMYAAKRAGRPIDGPPLRETRRRKLG
jgi:diguanylate cyclase (GGDEF)-like protein